MTCNNCNPCDDCTPKCNECCNPNIVWWECVDVDVSEEGVITISAPCPTEVTSDDWTIGVTEKEPHEWYSKRFDLTVNKPDKKVWACDSDSNPWSLYDKLEEWHWIDIDLVNCPWDASVRISVDENELNIPNDKVAVSGWCSSRAWYLKDVLKSTSRLVEFVQNDNCEYILRDTGWYQSWKMVLTNTIIKSMEWNQIWRYILSPTTTDNEQNLQQLSANFQLDETVSNWMVLVAWWLWATKSWIYLVSFNGNFEANFGIHWMRLILYKGSVNSETWKANYTPLIESRYSWPVWHMPSHYSRTSEEDWARAYNWLAVNIMTEAEWVDPWAYSATLWWVLDRMPNGWFTLVRLNAWEWIWVWATVQSSTSYNWDYIKWYWAEDDNRWKFAILWADWWKNTWSDVWTQVCAYMLVAL